MTSFRNIISIVTAVARDDANATLNAIGGFGPLTYGLGLSPDGTWPPTHYCSNHGHTTVEEHATWAALLDGELPEIYGEWGEDGAPSEIDAIAAFTGGNVLLDCISHTDAEKFNAQAHFDAIAQSQGLQVSSPPE